MRLNRITGIGSSEFVFRVHGFGGIGAKADSLIRHGECFLNHRIRIPNGHVLSSQPYFNDLVHPDQREPNGKIRLSKASKPKVEKILETIDGGPDQVFRSSFEGDVSGNGIYTSKFAPLTKGITAIEQIMTDAFNEDAIEFRAKRNLPPSISILIMPPVLDPEFDCPLLSGCGYTLWGPGNIGRLAIVAGFGTKATGQTAFIDHFDFSGEVPDNLIKKLTNEDNEKHTPERLVRHELGESRESNGSRDKDFIKKFIGSNAYMRAVYSTLHEMLSDFKNVENDIGRPFYFEFALARRVNAVEKYLLQVAPYDLDTKPLDFPSESIRDVIWTKEVAGRCKRRATAIVSVADYSMDKKEMRRKLLEINRTTKDYILVVADIHSAMAGPNRWLSYACFSNAVAIVEINSNHDRAESAHFRGLLSDSKIPLLSIYWQKIRNPFPIQALDEFKTHPCVAEITVDDSAYETPKGAILFTELPKLDRPNIIIMEEE